MLPVIIAICLLLSGCMTISQGSNPQETATIIKVLSINLCASWNSPRKDRADKIIELVRAEKVDIILFQEGVKGIGQFDMAEYIAKELGYSYCQSPAFGVPIFFEFSVGIISAYSMINVKTIGCQVPGEDWIDKFPFPGSGRGVLATVGGIQVMSCHLSVPVPQATKEMQVSCLQVALPPGITIWGGDFNFVRSDPAYSLIKLQEAVYSGPPQVDMVFSSGLSVLESRLVFEDRVVSDHAGVLVTYRR